MQLLSDGDSYALLRSDRSVIARGPNEQTHLARPWPSTAFRPRPKSAIQITGKNRHIPTSQKGSDACFEFLENAVRGTGSLRENDQDVARLGEKLTAKSETLPGVRLARERQRVNHYRGDPRARHALEKIIRCRCRKSPMQPT